MSEMTRISAELMSNFGWTRSDCEDVCFDNEGTPTFYTRGIWTKEGQQQLLSYGWSADFLVDRVQMDHLQREGVILPPHTVE